MRSWYPGFLPLAAGRSVSLAPRDCGVLKVGRGKLAVAGRLLGPGEKLQLWRGDAVDVANVADRTTAFFSWDACLEQPSVADRLRHVLARVKHILKREGQPKLEECGDATWCVRA
jgi:hypothetical protein